MRNIEIKKSVNIFLDFLLSEIMIIIGRISIKLLRFFSENIKKYRFIISFYLLVLQFIGRYSIFVRLIWRLL